MSLTPLIDVVFILLIFFMLATSFLDWRTIRLEPPAASSGGAAVEGALLVELRPDGLRLAGAATDPLRLEETLRARLQADPAQKILIRAAPGVALQEAVELLDLIGATGGRDVRFLSRPGG